jgi:hypothetical protein
VGGKPETKNQKPETQTERPSARPEIIITVVAFLVLALIGGAALLWKPLLNSYDSYQLRKLRAAQGRTDLPKPGTDELFWGLLCNGALKKGMTYEQVVAIIGKPDRDLNYRDAGRRRCEWQVMDLGRQMEAYVITFGPDGGADFVPYVYERSRDSSGTKWARMYRSPEEEKKTEEKRCQTP